jgi:hypothetical protein
VYLGSPLDNKLFRPSFGSKIACANRKEGDRVGADPSTETGCGG